MRPSWLSLVLAFTFVTAPLRAELSLPSFFSNGMVLAFGASIGVAALMDVPFVFNWNVN